MTKKDFERIARAIARVETITEDVDLNGIGSSTLRLVVVELGAELKAENPRFDRGKFEKAALPIQSERMKQVILGALARQGK